ncbi:MAG: chorismate mutase [Candidatus Berkiellales bacterium]
MFSRKNYFLVIAMISALFLISMSRPILAHTDETAVAASTQLFNLMSQRLSLMRQIALYKYYNNIPIYVPEVEKRLLSKVKIDAEAFDLDVEKTQAFVQMQMDIAKVIQHQWHDYWREKGAPKEDVYDLDQVMRPELARLTAAIIEQVSTARSELTDPELHSLLKHKIDEAIDIPFVSNEYKQKLLQSLIEIADGST